MLKGNSRKKSTTFFKNLTKNSDASATLKSYAFSSASFTLCIVATLRKALALRRANARGALMGLQHPIPQFENFWATQPR